MTDLWIHPAMVIMVGALLLPFIPRTPAVLKSYLVTVPVLAFLSVLLMEVPGFLLPDSSWFWAGS